MRWFICVHCWFSEPSTHRLTEPEGRYHILDSLTRVNTVCPALEMPWGSTPSNLQLLTGMKGSCFPYEGLMLYNFLNPFKQATASLSEPLASELPVPNFLLGDSRHGTSSSQPRFTTWLHLGISKPRGTRSSHLRLLYSSCRAVPGKTQVVADLGVSTTQETPGPSHPVDSNRPLQSTTTLPLHSWSTMEGGGWW